MIISAGTTKTDKSNQEIDASKMKNLTLLEKLIIICANLIVLYIIPI